MKKFLLAVCSTAVLAACASEGAIYTPQAQIMPQHIKKVAVRPILNKTEVFALEDKFYNELYDEFCVTVPIKSWPKTTARKAWW